MSEFNRVSKIVTYLSSILGIYQWQHEGNHAIVGPSKIRDEMIVIEGIGRVIVVRKRSQGCAQQWNATANRGIIHPGNSRHVCVETADDGWCLCIDTYSINVLRAVRGC